MEPGSPLCRTKWYTSSSTRACSRRNTEEPEVTVAVIEDDTPLTDEQVEKKAKGWKMKNFKQHITETGAVGIDSFTAP